jgi:SAM-dependent methyltransferase
MAHVEMNSFLEKIKKEFPNYFKNVNVLDFGSLDINGDNRIFFEDIEYTGVDIGEGKNVDIVSLAHRYKPNKKFDVVISTEVFEHDVFWKQSFLNGFDLLKEGGFYIFTCAGYGRPEHGTQISEPESSPFTTKINELSDYYENRTTKDFINIMDFEKEFSEYSFTYKFLDLYFYGIKRKLFEINFDIASNKVFVKNISGKDKYIWVKIFENNVQIYQDNVSISHRTDYWFRPDKKISNKSIIEIFENNKIVYNQKYHIISSP